ncbi:hypothetical protein [Saccharopolyspora mangrovi]|uniref:Uncharacterized protein n=1 Tax=Saccharopolyspora mangrovi TaxID=3082379 RepID=A0ABU6A9V8_9PSEU|nr:hypothetical protein [Saccharopolyspora sp. S2-29]MEB3368352.1 hypothetical protein [Saccharopolyspora sp. S2-29]
MALSRVDCRHLMLGDASGTRSLACGYLKDFESRSDGVRATTKQLKLRRRRSVPEFATATVTKSTRPNTSSNTPRCDRVLPHTPRLTGLPLI